MFTQCLFWGLHRLGGVVVDVVILSLVAPFPPTLLLWLLLPGIEGSPSMARRRLTSLFFSPHGTAELPDVSSSLIHQFPYHLVTGILYHNVLPFASNWLSHFQFQGFHLFITYESSVFGPKVIPLLKASLPNFLPFLTFYGYTGIRFLFDWWCWLFGRSLPFACFHTCCLFYVW